MAKPSHITLLVPYSLIPDGCEIPREPVRTEVLNSNAKRGRCGNETDLLAGQHGTALDHIVGPGREIYLHNTMPSNPDDPSYVTEVQYPVEKVSLSN